MIMFSGVFAFPAVFTTFYYAFIILALLVIIIIIIVYCVYELDNK